ncbi:MAG: chromosome segregation protein SMC [Actinomycetota bacterium]|nr:chromosome segregation protein SMC [Actinomycetota bacterium]
MYLRSVTIRGFKSFANKSVLRFEPGTTVIVGPNGSGKSNITDAVLWALGEQSARNLRGSSMEDVIFAGSTSKQALGTAEVAITLDNSDGAIPIDFSEVTISRRLYRSGESEYALNRTPCRLIDIHEILSDTGLGREMYSVISQGRLDDILNSKPSERRQLLEEAAGVLKHKRRKERALRKLVAMDNNMARGKDILREVGRQLAPLRKQADQATQFSRLSRELKEVQVAAAVAKLRVLRSSWEELARELAAKNKVADELKQELEHSQSGVTEMENELEAKGFLAGDISEYRRRLEGLQERINSGLLLLEEKGKNLIAKLSEFRQTVHRLDSRTKQRTKEITALSSEKAGLESQLGELYHTLGEARREAETAKKAAKQAAHDLAGAEGRLSAQRGHVAKEAGEMNHLSSIIESTREKLAFLQEQKTAITEKQAALERDKQVIADEHGSVSADMPRLKLKLEQIKRRVDRLIESKADKDRAVEASATEYRESQATIAALEALSVKAQADYSWLDRQEELPKMAGKVADLITVQKKYEKAIEVALGLDVHALVATDLATAIAAYRRIRREGEKPARLIAGGALKASAGPPGLTAALDVIDCPEGVRAAITGLLAKVWITDDMAAFLESRYRLPDGGLVVDSGGDYVDSRGLIARQPTAKDMIGSLASKRELTELHKQARGFAAALDSHRQELSDINAELDEKQLAALAATAEMQKSDGRIMTLALRLQGLDKEIAGLGVEHTEISSRMAAKEKAFEEDIDRLRLLKQELQKNESGLGGFDGELKAKKEALTARMDAEKEVAVRLSQAQVSMASLTERQTHIKSRLIAAEDDLSQATQALTQQHRMISATEELRLRIQPVHDLYTALRLQAEVWAGRLEETAHAERAGAAAMREELRARHQRGRDVSADLELTNETLKEKEVAKAQVETEVNQITRYLVEDLEVALETALVTEDKTVAGDVWQRKEEQLRTELSRLGPINQVAAAEFSRLEERHEFLGRQIDDLTRSKKALQKVVDAIENKIHAKFLITFDEVNTNFNRVFNELFPGGTARLALVEDEQDGGEPGVEVEAQPHGKRLQSLSLLSGGERSLVGLAILFALFYTRPSPFYILDEVEAALDDVNLQRFINLMKKLKNETQFLIVTHQRRTMETADCVYGVSMQADGISKIISQKLAPEDISDEQKSEAELVGTAVGQPDQIQEQL